MLHRVLVANRGEIAVRVVRACRELGIGSVAVYSDADRNAPHVEFADDAFYLGASPATESYLHIERIITLARQAGADAVHPGYGFLSENPAFAKAVQKAGLVFIGPSHETIKALNGKVAARKAAQEAGLPIVPGMIKPLRDTKEARRVAAEYGYPVALKAVGGGIGRGMRIIQSEEGIDSAFQSLQREAKLRFNNDKLYLEKFFAHPRHIEVQVVADLHGSFITIGDRDCSIQRRRQKLIEEAPATALSDAQREHLWADALKLPRAVGYTGVGTMAFLVQDNQHYFLAINARIQVEHTVTELAYGIDLVQAQLRIAGGEPLWLTQAQITPRGHAIQCRINAEDALANFSPAVGTIAAYREPAGFGVRVDSGVRTGATVSEYYDSLLAKLITWGQDRDQAIARMRSALSEYQIEGVTTSLPFSRAAVEHPVFVAGDATVDFLPAYRDEMLPKMQEFSTPIPTPLTANATLVDEGNAPPVFDVEVNNRHFTVRVIKRRKPDATRNLPMAAQPAAIQLLAKSSNAAAALLTISSNAVIAPLQGVVDDIRVQPGQQVKAGQVVCILQAMKMENEIAAPRDGIISEVRAEMGKTVPAGTVLVLYIE